MKQGSIEEHDLTPEERRLLSELAEGERTISGGRQRIGLARLLERGLVRAQAVNLSDVVYTITEEGFSTLATAGQSDRTR